MDELRNTLDMMGRLKNDLNMLNEQKVRLDKLIEVSCCMMSWMS